MVAIRIDTFGGEQPRVSKRLLPPNASVDARNCDLQTGELRGLRGLELLADLSERQGAIRRVYRLPDSDTWLSFSSADVDVVRGPLVNDALDRYYWTGDGAPKYNTRARIENGDPAYNLGISAPTVSGTLGISGGTGDPETRVYLYTFVNEFGEESQPSPPVIATGPEDATWTLSNMSTLPPSHVGRVPAQFKRIYRSITGGATVTNRFVAQIPVAQTSYADSIPNTTVARNDPIESELFAPPPFNLRGLTVMANGMVAGFVGRDLYICEPYRPHAWPVEYILTVEHDIVGLASYGQSLVIMTNSNPIVASGINPMSITLSKISNIEPCVSKRGIVTTEIGVFYPSDNGLVLVVPGQARNITKDLITREQWLTNYRPGNVLSAQLGMRYVAFNSRSRGFVLGFDEPLGKVINVDWFDQVDGVETDYYNGTVYLIRNKQVYEWDSPNRPPIYYTWWSKRFTFPQPINFGALKLRMDTSQLLAPQNQLDAAELAYNQLRIECPLDTINMHPINDIWDRCVTAVFSRTDDFSTYAPFGPIADEVLLGDIIWNTAFRSDLSVGEVLGTPALSMAELGTYGNEDEAELEAFFNLTGTTRLDSITLKNTFPQSARAILIAYDEDDIQIADIELGILGPDATEEFPLNIQGIRRFVIRYILSEVLTSNLYPVVSTDFLTNTGNVQGSLFWQVPLDDLTNSGSVLDGDLRAILQTYQAPHEDSLENSGSVLGGDINAVLISYQAPHEDSLTNSGSVLSGDLS